MKAIFSRITLLYVCFLFFSCERKEETMPVVTNPSQTDDMMAMNPPATGSDSLLLKGNFMNNVHNVSGKVSIYKNKDGKKTIVMESFKTDGGPDLRIYLSKDLNASDFYQISLLPGTTGNFTFTLDNNINPSEHKYVLIWCRQFSVLFGNAELKP